MKKINLLQRLQEEFPEFTKEKLYAFVMCGDILVDGGRIRDPKIKVSSEAVIEFRSKRFVSRGGDKLQKALETFNFDVRGKVVIDAGSSTGGFTDCLLQAGARAVHAIEVGTNQMVYRLREDPRVILKEQTGILDVSILEPEADMAVADISFRSIVKPAKHLLSLSREKKIIVLIKPQFEWENPGEKFSGVVTDPKDRKEILLNVAKRLSEEKITIEDMINSPISGRKGNREYLFLLTEKKDRTESKIEERIEELILKDNQLLTEV